MRKYRNQTALLFLIVLSSCIPPSLHYIGDTLAPSQEIDVYYAIEDISIPYRTMGKMSFSESEILFNAENAQRNMIELAQAKGADAILFEDLYSSIDGEDDCDEVAIRARVLKYLDSVKNGNYSFQNWIILGIFV